MLDCQDTPSSADNHAKVWIGKLQKAGVTAKVDVYKGGYHAFDMMDPDNSMSIRAAEKFCEAFMFAKAHYFAPQEDQDGKNKIDGLENM
jgi:dienelactone hydrolase